MFRTKFTLSFLFTFVSILAVDGQQVTNYNLAHLSQQNGLETTTDGQEIQTFVNPKNQAISVNGIAWLKGVTFKDGTIDVDLRGKDVFLQSFVGIAFHAKDTSAYELVYFRPFRFHSTDTPTRKWSVQYMSLPVYDYDKLRKEHRGVYENAVNPVPGAADWFHATIVVKGDWIMVYVNHSSTASLKVKKLNDLTDGKIGLWSSPGSLSSDFANLGITQ